MLDLTGRNSRAKTTSTVDRTNVWFDGEVFELWVGRTLVKRLDARAMNQILILQAFQEEGWPQRIDDPLPPKPGSDCKARLRSTIHSLNGCHVIGRLRFFADGSGAGVRWKLLRQAGPGL